MQKGVNSRLLVPLPELGRREPNVLDVLGGQKYLRLLVRTGSRSRSRTKARLESPQRGGHLVEELVDLVLNVSLPEPCALELHIEDVVGCQ